MSSFSLPEMSDLIALCNKAAEMIDNPSKDTLDDLGFIILDDRITSCNVDALGTSYMDAADKYVLMQPKMEAKGILGPDYRIVSKAGNQLSCSAAFTEGSFQIAQEVLPRLAAFQPDISKDDGSFYFPTVSAFFIKQPNGPPRAWYHVDSSKDAPFVALVALTAVNMHFVPHGAKQRPMFDSLITDGGTYKDKRPVPLLLSPEMCTKVDESFPTCCISLETGQVVVIHRSTPICFEGIGAKENPEDEEEEAAFVVKSVVLERLRKTTRRKIIIAQALEKGGVFPEGLFNEYFPLDELQPCETEEKLFEVASPKSVPFFVQTAPAAPKPAAPIAKKIEPVAPPASPAKHKTEVLPPAAVPIKKMSSEEEEVSSSSSSSSSASKPVVRPALQEQFNRYDALMGRARAIDPRAWNERNADIATKKYIELQNISSKEADGAKITQFKKVIDTLEKNVKSAEGDVVKLPAIQEKLERCSELLDQWTDLPEKAKGEIRLYKAYRSNYEEYSAPKANLISLTKSVDELLEKCISLEKKVEERLAKLAAEKSGGGVKRGRQEEAAPTVNDVLDGIDPIVEDELEPDIRAFDGDDGWKAVISNANAARQKYIVMAQSIGNPVVFKYCNSLEQEYLRLQESITESVKTQNLKVTELELDVSKLVAYHNVLQEIFVKHGDASERKATAPTGPVSKSTRCKCANCEKVLVNFDQSGFCRECYVTEVHTPAIAVMQSREEQAQLTIKANKQAKLPKGDLETKFDEYLTFAEALTIAGETMESTPNAKNLADFKSLYARADKLLPQPEEDDGSFEGDEEEEEEEEENSFIALPNDYSEQEEVSSSSAPRSKKRERAVDPDGEIAMLGMDVLSCFPVQTVHQKALSLWKDKSKRERLRHYLEETKETSVVWAVMLTDLTDPTAPKVEHDCYVDKQMADLIAVPLRNPGVTSVEVVKREIIW